MLCEKIKKITEALYRVTELFSDKEPLKWQMRTTGLELFNFLTSNEEKEIFDANKIFDLIRQLNRLLQLAYASSTFVSSINFEILRREYLSLSDSIATQMEKRKQEFLSLENLLPVPSCPICRYRFYRTNCMILMDKPLLITDIMDKQ